MRLNRSADGNLQNYVNSLFHMPALPHPLTLEDQMLAGHRWQARRALWPQTLFLAATYGVLAWVLVLLWWRVDAHWITAGAMWIRAHETLLALAAIGVAMVLARTRLRRDARRHAASAGAAMPVWRDMQRRRDTRTRMVLGLHAVASVTLVVGMVALHDPGAAWSSAASLRWSLLAALLTIVFMPAPAGRASTQATRPPRLAQVPRWLASLGSTDLPHLPQWWWQRAGSAWMRGRAATAMATGLLLAPTEAIAILLPMSLLMLAALFNALDVAHRLAAEVASVLAARPPCARRLWRALWPLHLGLTGLLAFVSSVLLQLVRITPAVTLVIGVAVVITASIDFLLAIVLRHAPHRLGLARMQLAVLAAALASAMPPLLPLAASGLLVLLARRVWRGDVHA